MITICGSFSLRYKERLSLVLCFLQSYHHFFFFNVFVSCDLLCFLNVPPLHDFISVVTLFPIFFFCSKYHMFNFIYVCHHSVVPFYFAIQFKVRTAVYPSLESNGNQFPFQTVFLTVLLCLRSFSYPSLTWNLEPEGGRSGPRADAGSTSTCGSEVLWLTQGPLVHAHGRAVGLLEPSSLRQKAQVQLVKRQIHGWPPCTTN